MSELPVLVSRGDTVTTITLSRPEALNAITEEMLVLLGDALEEAAGSDARVVVLTGAGRAFSAGVDLKALGERSLSNGMVGDFLDVPARRVIDLLTTMPKVVIAKVNGFCFTGALELVLACDMVIAAEHARFGLPEPRVGLMAAAGGAQRLARQLPLKIAMGMMLTGEPISAARAQELGLVNEVVPAAGLIEAVEGWTQKILECSPLSVRATKQAAMDSLDRPTPRRRE